MSEQSSDATGDATLSYEQARDELAEVVRRLEAGGLPLEEALSLWERGERLATICQHWLDGARQRLAAATQAAAQGDEPTVAGSDGPRGGDAAGSVRPGS